MTIETYERPREKLLQKGVSVLTNSELLQVIIGSGSAGMPVTKIARKVEKILRVKGLAIKLTELTVVQGLGVVKAAQVLAGLELASRLVQGRNDEPNGETSIITGLYSDVRGSKKTMLLYAFFDGNGRLIDDHSEFINPKASTTRIARKLFGEALAQSTASVLVVIGGENQPLEPSMFELSLARDVYSTATLLSMTVKSFVLVGASGEHVMKEAKRG